MFKISQFLLGALMVVMSMIIIRLSYDPVPVAIMMLMFMGVYVIDAYFYNEISTLLDTTLDLTHEVMDNWRKSLEDIAEIAEKFALAEQEKLKLKIELDEKQKKNNTKTKKK